MRHVILQLYSEDGTTVHGWLLRPLEYGTCSKKPLCLWGLRWELKMIEDDFGPGNLGNCESVELSRTTFGTRRASLLSCQGTAALDAAPRPACVHGSEVLPIP